MQLQLSRVTVALDSTRYAADVSLSSPVLVSYDLVAVRPGDAAALRHAVDCGAVDIVQLDLSSGRLPFPLRAEGVAAVLGAGLVFEVDFGAAIRDAASRQFLISNARSLLRLTRGRGVLLTSGARSPLELRSPGDAAAIAGLFGLSRGAALVAMSETASAVLRHAQLRRRRATTSELTLHVVPVSSLAPMATAHVVPVSAAPMTAPTAVAAARPQAPAGKTVTGSGPEASGTGSVPAEVRGIDAGRRSTESTGGVGAPTRAPASVPTRNPLDRVALLSKAVPPKLPQPR